jgi:hypothetical protein
MRSVSTTAAAIKWLARSAKNAIMRRFAPLLFYLP